jgi:hypothetical protein
MGTLSWAGVIVAMLRRSTVVLAMLLASCSRAPDYSGCRLVGTWRFESEQQKHSDSDTTVPDAHAFSARGGWVEYNFPSRNVTRTGGWKLITNESQRVSVTVSDPVNAASLWNRTFVFDTNDRMREQGGPLDGKIYVRLTAPK